VIASEAIIDGCFGSLEIGLSIQSAGDLIPEQVKKAITRTQRDQSAGTQRASVQLSGLELGVYAVSQLLARCHSAAVVAARTSENGSWLAFTPRTYLAFLSLYLDLLRRESAHGMVARERMRVGLLKLGEASEGLRALQV